MRAKDIVKINPKNECADDTIAAFIPMEKIEATFLSQFSYTKAYWYEIKSAFTHFADGDIAFAKITPCFQNRKSMVLQNLPNGIGAGTTELKVLRPYGETVQPFFLMYFLETPYFVENASFKGTANQQRILVGYLENKLLPLPPLREQRKISNTITDFLRLLE
ncbi:type I restriction-modification system, specificity subunit S [Porphyromonas crevioricanis JCM 15906]|nr:restriction endonuclease subunit S [Porphyromonas crevioricanis]GAD04964.1 type I restriction-modification system, specificity subunit S [Porphyromonas crevioricanis JCM 15906]GAD07476.1 type I restriction-modification system, specificity subunit S [Porphyromonas crevioricanis JCM 13913]